MGGNATLYPNGEVPLDVVSVVLGTGYEDGRYWEHRLTPATAARWAEAQRYALEKFGRTILIRSGSCAYRPLDWQIYYRQDACAQGNCNGASVPRYSSHGGNWNGRDCLAIDVDPNGLTWDQVWEACEHAGFSCGLITEAISSIAGGEPWHIIDFAAFGAVPTFTDPALLRRQKEDSMYVGYTDIPDVVYEVFRGVDGKRHMAVLTAQDGAFARQGGLVIYAGKEYIEQLAKDCAYEAPVPTVASEVWGQTVDRGTGAPVKPTTSGRVSALQELADVKSILLAQKA